MSRSVSETAQHTDALLRDVVRLFLQAQRELSACCSDATAKECQALLLLGAAPEPLTVLEFASRMGLEKTWASRLVDRLVRDGLVRRADHPTDGRSRLLELTRKGRQEHAKLDRSLNAHAVNLLGCVPAAERPGVERALTVLRDALTRCLAATGPEENRSC